MILCVLSGFFYLTAENAEDAKKGGEKGRGSISTDASLLSLHAERFLFI